jgi:CBS domain-containing protein
MSRADVGTSFTGYAKLGPLQTLLAWLGPINLVIGVFNLIPAFPLDGGRVLRSILWATSGNLRTSTRRVSAVGQLFGWMFIVMGIAMTFGVRFTFFGTGVGSGLWLAFIGWFLHNAATQSHKRLAIDDALAGHTVEEVMRRGGPTVPPDIPLTELVRDYIVQSDERALPVVSDGQLLGLVSASDVRAVPPAEWPTTQVASVMHPRPSLAVAAPHEPLAEAFAQLARSDIGQLPVLEEGRLVGTLQQRDIARWLELASGLGLRRSHSAASQRVPPRHAPSAPPGDEPHAPPA